MTSEKALRVMIVDDEPHAREGLRLRLKRESDVLIVGEFNDATSALQALRDDTPDVLFLDIEMPGMDGFSLLEKTGHSLPAIVFVTAHSHHAVRAFDARAFDYLLKPVEQERLRETLKRVRQHLHRDALGEMAERMRDLVRKTDENATFVTSTTTTPSLDRIPVSREGSVHFVATNHIDYIAAAGDAIMVHVGKETHVVRRSMGEIMSMLDATKFARIHRSTIVNLERVVKLEPYFHGEYLVLLQTGQKLKLSRGYRSAVSQMLGLER